MANDKMAKLYFEQLKNKYEQKISDGSIKADKNGYYKAGEYLFDDGIRIFVRGRNAEEIARKFEKKFEESAKPKESEKGRRFGDVCAEWFEFEKQSGRLGTGSLKNTAMLLNNHILPCFQNKGVAEITAGDIENFLNHEANFYTLSTVSKLKNTIHNILIYAIKNEWLQKDVCQHINMPRCVETKKPASDEIIITEDEFSKILAFTHNDSMMRLILSFAYIYGMRTCEIANLSWKNIDFQNDRFKIEVSKYTDTSTVKNKETKMRYLPLSPALKPLLIEAYNNRAEGQEYLFSLKRENCTASSKDFSRYINTLRNRINSYYPELKHFTLYYLRKTVATNLEICEVGNPWAKQFFGHSPTDVKAKHYDKFDFEKHLRKKYQPYMEYADKSFSRCLEKSEDIYEELVNANVFNSKNGKYIHPEKRHKSATKSKPKYTHFGKCHSNATKIG